MRHNDTKHALLHTKKPVQKMYPHTFLYLAFSETFYVVYMMLSINLNHGACDYFSTPAFFQGP
mgnify:CR=1 FL=1